MSKRQAEKEAAQFNARYPVGTPVRYWPWVREGRGFISEPSRPTDGAAEDGAESAERSE